LLSYPAPARASHLGALLLHRVPFVETPNRSAATCNLRFGHRRNDLLQRQIRLFDNQVQQKLSVIFQWRDASIAWSRRNASGCFLTLHPNHHNARAKPIEFGGLAPRCRRCDRCNHTFTQVRRIRLGHWPPQSESMPADSCIDNSLRIPRSKVDGKCSNLMKTNFLAFARRREQRAAPWQGPTNNTQRNWYPTVPSLEQDQGRCIMSCRSVLHCTVSRLNFLLRRL
jgi:hypothetical protein